MLCRFSYLLRTELHNREFHSQEKRLRYFEIHVRQTMKINNVNLNIGLPIVKISDTDYIDK